MRRAAAGPPEPRSAPVARSPAEELRLAKALAQQATLVLQLSRLSRQARESAVIEERERVARERAARLESATAALQSTLSHLVSAHDSVALLDHIMHGAAAQMQASMTGVYLYDETDDLLRLASCVSEGEVIDVARDERFVLWRSPAPAASVQTWRTIMRSEHYAWFSTSADNHGAPNYPLNWHRATGHRSLLAVPLKLGNRALGFVGMFFAHERLPDEDRLELARVFGQQAALAAQMADLADRAKQAAVSDERLAQLVRTNEALTHTLDRLATESSLDTALGDMLIAISQHLGAPSSTLWLHDADNACGRLHLLYDRGRLVPGDRSNHPNAGKPLPLVHGKPLFKRMFEGVVSIVEVSPEEGLDPLVCAELRAQGIDSVLVIPMRAGGVLLGSCIVRLPNAAEVTAEQIEFARILVQQATLLLEVTRLAEAGQEAALSHQRERIATEKAAELQAVNEALQRAEQLARAHTTVITNTLQSITREPTLDSFIGQVLPPRRQDLRAKRARYQLRAGDRAGRGDRAGSPAGRLQLRLGWCFLPGEKRTSGTAGLAIGFAAAMVFLILAAQYERWSLPLTVLLALPFGTFGAVAAVWLRGFTNDVYFQIGLVTLLGLAAKNAILIVEFANLKHREGLSTSAAALEAARLRFRPILMTSLAFILGVLPLAVSTGAGAGARQSVGTGVMGGMLAATFLAIFFVPLFFKLVSDRRLAGEKRAADELRAEAAPPVAGGIHPGGIQHG